ncbi:MAG: hypothetical protein AMS22_05575 [Thiotrichales bacterium SG8_50]|nr:MAG: hypothetical protein AMS22_05575 [Thiotrichales bacterium SG8_50]
MPHSSLKLIPGVDQNRTLALNEAAISITNLIRFIPDRQGLGLVQKLGGWTQFYPSSIGSIVRCLLAWEDINGNAWLASGAEASLSVITQGGLRTITPQTTEADVAVAASTTLGSSTVTITASGSNLDAYDTVDIQTQISVGGLILFGVYAVTPVSTSQFQIQAVDALGAPVYATSTSTTATIPSFTFVSGASTVNVTLANHGYQVGDTFPILVSTTAGTITLFGNYTISALDPTTPANIFTISAASSATTTPTLSATGAAGVATLTYSTSYTIPVGSTIVVANVLPAVFNGTFTVTASGAGTVSYAIAAGTYGPQTQAGTIFVQVASENGGLAQYVYYNGIGPLAANSGYGVGGYGSGGFGSGIPPSSGTGTPISVVDWTLDNWGETLLSCPLMIPPGQPVTATASGGGIYQWSPTTNNPVATIIPTAPVLNSGIFVAMPQRQIIAWGSTFNGIQDQLLLRWCDVDNYGDWIAQTTNQAGSFRIPKGSRIVQCIQGPQQGLIWTDLGVWAMQYVGQPYVYQFNELGTGCGLIGRKAATSVGGIVYWMGQSQFFRLSPNGVETVKCPVWDVIFQDLDTDNLDKIRVAANSQFNEIAWYYPTNSNGGEINAYVKYNITLDQWDFGSLARTAWINQSVLGPPIGAGTDTNIYQHETSPDANGQPINASFETGYFALSDADVKMFVDQVWPDMKWGYYGGAQNATVSLTFYATDYPGQTPTAYGPFSLTQATTFVTPRMRGRLVSIKVESDDLGSFWRIGNIRYRVQQDGKY